MKPIVYLILFLFITKANGQVFPVYPETVLDSALLEVTYIKKSRLDSLDPNDIKSEKMLLWIGSENSTFFSYSRYLSIEANKKHTTRSAFQEWFNDPNRYRGGWYSYYEIFKKFPSGVITITEYLPSDYFIYHESFSQFQWKLMDKHSEILGVRVQMATTRFGGRDWIAWFTPEIPFSDGPYKFSGLPGLILKIHDSQNHYVFEATEIKNAEDGKTINFINRRYIETDKARFLQTQKAFWENLNVRLSQMLVGDHSQQVANNAQTRNNPIELTAD